MRARRGRGKREKSENGTRGAAHHRGRNPTSYPRRRSCLSVYSSVYSRGRRPQSIDFTPVPRPPSFVATLSDSLSPCPGRLHPRSSNISPPAHTVGRSSHQLSLGPFLVLSFALSPSRPPQFHSTHRQWRCYRPEPGLEIWLGIIIE